MQQQTFEWFLKPLLKASLHKDNRLYFYQQSERCWILDFQPEDFNQIQLIEQLCGELKDLDKELCINIIKMILKNLHDNRKVVESEMSKREETFDSMFSLYKALYENEFKLWSTPIYAYICKKHTSKKINKQKILEASSPENYVNIGSSKKITYIENGTYGFPVIVSSINKLIRNSGGGHNSYEILDNGNCLLNDIDPRTGELKGTLEISISELSNHLTALEKTLMIFDVGVNIFIANNEEIRTRLGEGELGELKISEIERRLKIFIIGRQIEILNFEFSENRSELKIELKKIHKIPSLGVGQYYQSNGPGGDIVTQKINVKYIDQALGVIAYALQLNQEKPFNLSLSIKNENDEIIYQGDFLKNEISKLSLSKPTNKVYPQPIEGELPIDTYNLIREIRVPPGAGEGLHMVVNNPLFTKKAYQEEMKKIAIIERMIGTQ